MFLNDDFVAVAENIVAEVIVAPVNEIDVWLQLNAKYLQSTQQLYAESLTITKELEQDVYNTIAQYFTKQKWPLEVNEQFTRTLSNSLHVYGWKLNHNKQN